MHAPRQSLHVERTRVVPIDSITHLPHDREFTESGIVDRCHESILARTGVSAYDVLQRPETTTPLFLALSALR